MGDRQIGPTTAVMWTLYRSDVLKKEWSINLPHQWSALGSDQKDGTVDKSKRKQLSLKGSRLRGIVRRSVIQEGLRVERLLHTDRWFIHPTRMAPGCLL